MPAPTEIKRPSFDQTSAAWKADLAHRKLPPDLIWIFDENLCFESQPEAPEKFKLGFQTRFTPPPPDAERIAYDHFIDFEVPIVFYRLGSWRQKSVCLLLCDDWFTARTEADGFFPQQNWRILFRPGAPDPIEEIVDEPRWRQRLLRDRPIHALDFTMTLRGIDEILAHGRVLTSYEHYALKFLNAWRKWLTESQ